MAEAVSKELSSEYPDRSVRTRIEPDIIVAGDTRLLKLVIINLLRNAWKYSSHKSDALIEFGALQTESGPVYYVRDNGVGFDMNDADKLFRVFSRLPFIFGGGGRYSLDRLIGREF